MKQKIFWAVVGILAAAHLLLAIPALQYPERFISIDSQQYLDLAQGLIQTGHFVSLPDPTMDLLRTPGYPVFLATIKLLLGDFKWASLLQVLLVLVNGLILFQITRVLACSPRVGAAAVIFYLLSPNAAFEALEIMSETVTSFWLLLAFWMLAKFWNTRRWPWLVLSGIVMGVAALTRPACYPLFFVWLSALIIHWTLVEKKEIRGGSLPRAAILFFFSGFIFVFIWQIRNYQVHDAFTLSPVARSTFQNFIIGGAMAETYGITRDEAEYMINTAPNAGAFMLAYVKAHFPQFVKITFRGLLLSGLAVEYRGWAQALTGLQYTASGVMTNLSFNIAVLFDQIRLSNGWILLGFYALLMDVVVYGLTLFATWKVIIKRKSTPAVLVFFVIAALTFTYTVLTPLGHGASRFRVPVESFLALMAAFAFYNREEVQPSL